MSLDQLPIEEDLNELARSPDPDLLADPSGRQGVIGPVKDDMMVRMNRTLLPLRTLEGLRGQRPQLRCFFFLEDLKRFSFRRPVDLQSNLFPAPSQSSLIRLLTVTKASACQKMLPDDRHSSFHFPLMFGFSRFGGIRHKPVMSFQLPISPVQHGIIEVGLDHPGLQIVQNNRGRNTSKKLERPDMTIDPMLDVLAEDEPDKSVPTVGKGHDKGPGSPKLPGQRIHHHPRVTTSHLRLTPDRHFDANRYRRSSKLKPSPQIPLHRAITHPNPFLLPEQTPNLLGRYHWVFDHPFDPVVMGTNQISYRCLPKKRRIRQSLYSADQIRFLRKGFSPLDSDVLGPFDILTNGLPIKSQGPLTTLNTSSLMPLINHFDNLVHANLPPCHPSPPPVESQYPQLEGYTWMQPSQATQRQGGINVILGWGNEMILTPSKVGI